MRKYLLFACVFLLAAAGIISFDLGLAADKFSHLKVSFLLFVTIFSARLTFRQHASEAIALALSVRDVLLIGIFKELFDGAFAVGDAELADLAADFFGIMIPFLGILLAEFFEIGRETLVHSGSKKILRSEENYFTRQIKLLKKTGLKLIYQI